MNPTEQFKHKSGTRHVSTGFLQLLMAEHKQLSLIVFKHFIFHMNLLYLKAASTSREPVFVKPKPSSFPINLTGNTELPCKSSFTTRKSASNDWKKSAHDNPNSCPLLFRVSSEQKIPRVPRGPGSHSCGCVPVQVTKNRPVRMDTAYPGLLEPGHSLLQENPWILCFTGRKFIIQTAFSPPS